MPSQPGAGRHRAAPGIRTWLGCGTTGEPGPAEPGAAGGPRRLP